MIVQEIIPLKNGKVKVCLQYGADFMLYKKEASQYHIVASEESHGEPMELDTEVYEEIVHKILTPRAKKRAMHLLEKMDRSEKQLRDKLGDNGYPPESIDAAIDYVKSYHYVDDERYARSYTRMYQESRSKMRIRQDLMKKGISRGIIEKALEMEFQQSEEEMIENLLVRKKYDRNHATREEQAKMYRFLLQRGFKSSDISHVLRGEYLT